MAKAKANASQGIPELIEIAVGKHFRENNERLCADYHEFRTTEYSIYNSVLRKNAKNSRLTKPLSSSKVMDTKDSIYIGSDLPNEYTGSNYTYSLKGTVAKAKANDWLHVPSFHFPHR